VTLEERGEHVIDAPTVQYIEHGVAGRVARPGRMIEISARRWLTKLPTDDASSAMERTNVTEDDEGKQVVNTRGEKVGMVSEVRDGTAYVNPDPGITDSIRSRLGWGDADQDDYRLDRDRIATVTDDEIRLKK